MDTFEIPFLSLVDCLTMHAKWRPDKTAVVCADRRLTYDQFNRQVNRVANGLLSSGLSRGQKVAILMKNSLETITTIFGILKAGGVVVPLSSMVSGEVLTMMINDSDSVMFFVESPELHSLIAPYLQQFEAVKPDGLVALGFEEKGWHSFPDWVQKSSDKEPDIRIEPEDVLNIIYSSGTTGVPKGIVHTHFARYNWSYGLALALRLLTHSTTLLTTPLYTGGTWTSMLPSLINGGTIVIMPSFDPNLFLKTIQKERVTYTLMVPTQYIVTMSLPDFDTYDLSSLELIACGAAPLRERTKGEIVSRFNCKLIELYGLSEGPGTALYPEEMEGKTGSVGKPPPGGDIRIIDDQGLELPRGEAGEIVGYSTGMLKEYYKQPEKTADAVWRDEKNRTYIKTGDIGRLDEDGFLFILDRKKDMIVSGGTNIFASDIEEIVGKHPDVLDVAVIAIPHEKWGETPLALVIPKDGTEPKTQTIKEWSNKQLGKYQRLAAVEVRELLPRNALGKVMKRALREPYWKDVK